MAGVCVMQDEWKAAAERFISKRGYAAAQKLLASLQMEWQQLKAIRMRCCGASQVNLSLDCLSQVTGVWCVVSAPCFSTK